MEEIVTMSSSLRYDIVDDHDGTVVDRYPSLGRAARRRNILNSDHIANGGARHRYYIVVRVLDQTFNNRPAITLVGTSRLTH